MPIHDWTRVDSGTYHDFRQGWTIEIRNKCNRGILPDGYFAMADQQVSGPEPAVVTLKMREPTSPGCLTVADAPPRVSLKASSYSEQAIYARKANRIAIRHRHGRVVAVIEVISPANKDSKNAIASFISKAVDFLRNGINLVVIDQFPLTQRDPDGIHQSIWDELVGQPFPARPGNKPLTVAGYDAGDETRAYVEPVVVGEVLPDAPLLLAPGWYVNIPLERTYEFAWRVTPQPIRDLVAPPVA